MNQLTLLCIALLSCFYTGCQSADYVIPSASNIKDCPTGQECHTLSYYVSQDYFQSGSYIHLIFLSGEHILNESVSITKMDSVSFFGLGEWIQSSHWSVYQSTAIIRCASDAIVAFTIENVKLVRIKHLTLAQCRSAFNFSNVSQLRMFYVSIQNNSNTGFSYYSGNPGFSTISFCSFHQNCLQPLSATHCHHVLFVLLYEYGILSLDSLVFSFGKSLFASLYISADRTSAAVSIYISSSLFENNIGIGSGGIYFTSKNPIDLVIEDTKFTENVATGTKEGPENLFYGRPAGGMSIHCQGGPGLMGGLLNISISNCVFDQNIGGGAYISAIHVTISQTVFVNNTGQYGAALSLALNETAAKLINVLISSNFPPLHSPVNQYYGALSLYSRSVKPALVIISNVSITDNEMTGLISIGCSIQFINVSTTIANNESPLDGGGMWIDERTQLETFNSTIYLINNTAAMYGGGLFSKSQLVLYDFYYSRSKCPVANVDGVFVGNHANISGNDIFGGQYFNCWSSDYKMYYTFKSFFQLLGCNESWTVNDNINRSLLPSISSDPVAVCFCNEYNIANCYNRSIAIAVYPGQWISLLLVTVGICQGVSPGVLVVTKERVNIALGLSNQQSTTTCKQFTYQLKQANKERNGWFNISSESKGAIILKDSQVRVDVTFQPCPLGLEVTSDICDCNNVLKSLGGVQCNISNYYPISRSGSNWLDYNSEQNCTIVHKYCPFDYCFTSLVHLNLNQSDLQCAYNRSGTLCGQCQSGLSLMLGSNKCKECHNNEYILLVIAFIAAGILLVLFLFAFNTLTVSMGSINGLLFYANIVKLNEATFFPNGGKVPVLSQFIAWLNLDFGIQTCFFDGFNGYWKTWLQFVFPVYIWLLVSVAIIGCHYFGRLSRLCGNNAVPVLATLVLMSYTKLLLTIRNSLMISTINCDQATWNVWSVDGNIGYFSIKHILLMLMSILFLIIGLVYTVLVFSGQWLQMFSGRCCRSSIDPVVKFKPLIDAYTGPYKDNYRFWTGFLLLIRITMVAVFSYTSGTAPKVNNYVIVVVLFVAMCVVAKGIYRNALVNYLELGSLLNLSMLGLLNALSAQMEWPIMSNVITIVSVAIAMIMFCIILVAHVYIFINGKFGNYSESYVVLKDEDDATLKVELGSPTHIVNRRESLIFDFNM